MSEGTLWERTKDIAHTALDRIESAISGGSAPAEGIEEAPDPLIRQAMAGDARGIDELLDHYDHPLAHKGSGVGDSVESQPKSAGRVLSECASRGEYDTVRALSDVAEADVRGQSVELAEMDRQSRLREPLSHTTVAELAEGETVIQDQISTSGVQIIDGDIEQEPVAKYQPFQVRGIYGEPGLYAEMYRQESVVRDAVDSVVETQVSAEHTVEPPKRELLASSDVDYGKLEAWSEKLDGWLRSLDGGGLTDYIRHAALGVTIFGFAPFEIVWAQQDGTVYPYRLSWIEPQAIEDWVMDNRGRKLCAVEFDEGYDGIDYTLPVRGEALWDHRFLLARLSARGQNWEGISPLRAGLHWWKFKQLLGQIAAASSQKYGVPLTTVKKDVDQLEHIDNSDAGRNSKQEVVSAFNSMQAVEAPTFGLPDGLMAEIKSASGTMPDLIKLMEYCDQQMAKVFSNEGSLLGHNQTGSYALAEVQDNRFLRSAPRYSRVITEPLDRIIKAMTRAKFGQIADYPRVQMRLDTAHNTSKFIEDMSKAFGKKPITEWPEDVQRAVAEQAGLDRDAFDTRSEASKADAMEDVARRSMAGESDALESVDVTPQQAVAAELAETQTITADLDADRAEQMMDEVEDALGDELAKVAKEQAIEYERRIRDVQTLDAASEIARELERSFEDEYRAVVQDAIDELIQEGARSVLTSIGIDIPEDVTLEMESIDRRIDDEVEAVVQQIADEANGRNTGWLKEQTTVNVLQPEGEEDQPQPLQPQTTNSIASGVGAIGLGVGRHRAIRNGQKVAANMGMRQTDDRIKMPQGTTKTRGPKVVAKRSSQLDDNVCPRCLKRDFQKHPDAGTYVVGSSAYYSNKPPLPCLAGLQCRCAYIYEVPQRAKKAFEQFAQRATGGSVTIN